MNQIEDLEAFIRIVDAGSITQAASQLNTVKSAISQRLARLEGRLGVTLLQRTTRSQTLTEAGQQYYQSAIEIMAAMQRAEAQVKNQNLALAGVIKIAVPLSFGLMHLSQPLRAFNQKHPDVTMNVDFNDRQVDIMHEGFDLAIRVAQLSDSNLIAKKITHTDMVLSASESYLKKNGKPEKPDDLKHHHKLKYNQAKNTWRFRDSKGKTHQVKLPATLIANNGEFLRDAAIDGHGLVLLPDFICYDAIQKGQLTRLLQDYVCQEQLNIYAIYPPNRHLPQRVRILIDYLAKHFTDNEFCNNLGGV